MLGAGSRPRAAGALGRREMAGQHQVDIVRLGPGELIGRMGEQNPKRQAVESSCGGQSLKSAAGPNQGSSFPARISGVSRTLPLSPTAADVNQPGVGQRCLKSHCTSTCRS